MGLHDEQVLRPPLDERRSGVPSRLGDRRAAGLASGRRRHRHRLDDQGNVYFADLEGALDELGASVSQRQRDELDEEPGSRAAVGRRPPVARGRQRRARRRRRQHGLPRVPRDARRHVHLLVARLDRARTIRSAASSGRTRATLPGRAAAARRRTRSARSSASTPSRATSTTRATRATTSASPSATSAAGQRTGIQYANYNGAADAGRGRRAEPLPGARHRHGGQRLRRVDRQDELEPLLLVLDGSRARAGRRRCASTAAAPSTNEFDWAQAGAAGPLALAWYGTPRTAVGGSDGMPSSLADQGAATAYPWYGYAALVKSANTAKPQVLQARFTAKPMHYGAICNSGTTCATNPTADRQMADFFGFGVAQNGGLRIVYDDTTNSFDGAGLFVTRQLAGQTDLRARISATSPRATPLPTRPATRSSRTTRRAGVGPNLPQLDITNLKVSNPTPSTLRFQITVADLSQLTPPPGKTTPLWLVRFQALGPLSTGPQDVYHVYYVVHAEDGRCRAAVLRRSRGLPGDDADQLQDLPVPRRHRGPGVDQRQHDHDRRRPEHGLRRRRSTARRCTASPRSRSDGTTASTISTRTSTRRSRSTTRWAPIKG